MKRSLKLRIASVFTILITAALVAIGVVHLVFLSTFYYQHKEKELYNIYAALVNDKSYAKTDEFLNYCSVHSLTFAVTDSSMDVYSTNSMDGAGMVGRLLGNLLSMENENTKILFETKEYQIIQIHDRFVDLDYLELWGVLSDGGYFIVRCPVESMKDSASVSFQFYLYIGILIIIISMIVIAFMSNRIVRPLQELTKLSKRMADLDFTAKYESGGRDEIGILGENYNRMSEKLEETIKELQTANGKLQRDIEEKIQIDEMRKDFLSNVSHELKTPIALIQGYAEGLSDNINDDPESRAFYCDVIVDEANKMNSLVKKLLDLNQLEFGKEQLLEETFDLTELIHCVVDASNILIEQEEATVIYSEKESVYVKGDEFKIEQVLTNYLTNALRYMNEEKRIEIHTYRDKERVIVSVFNTGNPIPEEELSKIWVKFYKIDKARTRSCGGSGIGLSIVKAIMDAHKQRCWAENVEKGVVFSFSLKAADEEKTL